MKYYLNYLIIINFVTFITYGIDKYKAKRKLSRISEMPLLNFSLMGGAVGGILSMYMFHHKTRKKVFVIGNILCILIHAFIYYIFK